MRPRNPTRAAPADRSTPPPQVVVMGVAGCGKSTLAQLMANALALPFIEGDAFHPAANVDKMSRGLALDDADRSGWLRALATELGRHAGGAVLSCSALKAAYRDCLRADHPGLRFVYLRIAPELANARVAARFQQHFFQPSLVASQFSALEDPCAEAGVLALDACRPAAELCAEAVLWLRAHPSPFASEPELSRA